MVVDKTEFVWNVLRVHFAGWQRANGLLEKVSSQTLKLHDYLMQVDFNEGGF